MSLKLKSKLSDMRINYKYNFSYYQAFFFLLFNIRKLLCTIECLEQSLSLYRKLIFIIFIY